MYSVDFSQIQIKYILNILYLVYLSVIQFKSIWSNPLEMDNAMDYNTPNTVDLVYYNPRVSHTDEEYVKLSVLCHMLFTRSCWYSTSHSSFQHEAILCKQRVCMFSSFWTDVTDVQRKRGRSGTTHSHR